MLTDLLTSQHKIRTIIAQLLWLAMVGKPLLVSHSASRLMDRVVQEMIMVNQGAEWTGIRVGWGRLDPLTFCIYANQQPAWIWVSPLGHMFRGVSKKNILQTSKPLPGSQLDVSMLLNCIGWFGGRFWMKWYPQDLEHLPWDCHIPCSKTVMPTKLLASVWVDASGPRQAKDISLLAFPAGLVPCMGDFLVALNPVWQKWMGLGHPLLWYHWDLSTVCWVLLPKLLFAWSNSYTVP